MIKERITHNLLISHPIMHSGLYQLTRGNPDPDVPQIIFVDGVEMIMIVFAQYGVGMGIMLRSVRRSADGQLSRCSKNS
jgi:hypothetical protein